MNSPISNSDYARLADLLGEIRDNWVLLALALRDHITEMPSNEREEAMMLVESHISRIKETI